jgi:hypothetical protein
MCRKGFLNKAEVKYRKWKVVRSEFANQKPHDIDIAFVVRPGARDSLGKFLDLGIPELLDL